MEKQNFTDLIQKAKANNQTKTIQKIVPVKQTNEVQFSFYIEKDLLKKLKQQALNKDTSIKQLINESISNYID